MLCWNNTTDTRASQGADKSAEEVDACEEDLSSKKREMHTHTHTSADGGSRPECLPFPPAPSHPLPYEKTRAVSPSSAAPRAQTRQTMLANTDAV